MLRLETKSLVKKEMVRKPFLSKTQNTQKDGEMSSRILGTFVGMADQGGRRSRLSKISSAGPPALWAISKNVKCAPRHGQAMELQTGTSLAAPQAVGLAAYAASLPESPFSLSDPREDFDGYVADLQGILKTSSWELAGGKETDKELLVPLISNRFCEEVEGEEDEGKEVKGRSSWCACT